MRGHLRIYLGAAPGVGKTYAMLDEGARRASRGTDVVVGLVETHGRPQTIERLGSLEVVPRRVVAYRGQDFEEMDLPAVLARRPAVVLVDELAHSNVPGTEHEKRWQDVESILDAGIDVISTVNLQHLESVNDVVEAITGVTQRETVPDRVVRDADQIQLVDQTPEALRRRLAHGNIYPAEQVDAALSNFFRPGNLAALRELALLWLADRVDDEIQSYRDRHGIERTWETRERIAVAVNGDAVTERLIRRGARMAARSHAELVGIHVTRSDGLARAGADLERAVSLLDELGGRFVEVVGTDVAASLVSVARAEGATQLLLGAAPKSRWASFVRGSVVARSVALARGELDVHVISAEVDRGDVHPSRRRRWSSPVGSRRVAVATTLGVVGFGALTAALGPQGPRVLPLAISAYLLVVLAVAGIGGVVTGLGAAIVGFLVINYEYAPPVHTLTIANARDVAALTAFLAAALTVSTLVDLAARRTAAARRAERDARALARLAQRVASGTHDLGSLLSEVVRIFDLDGASIHSVDAGRPDVAVGSLGGVGATLPLGTGYELRVAGDLEPADRELLAAVAAQLVVALDRRRLEAEAAERRALRAADDLRASLLAAVSHDLRSPLASIKAAATTLLGSWARLDEADVDELLQGIDLEADRLNGLVGDLLDMSRIHEGTVEIVPRRVDVNEIVARAIAEARRVAPSPSSVARRGPEPLLVDTDPVLVERVVANLVRNALDHGGGSDVLVDAGRAGSAVVVRVIDHGPGIAPERRATIFEPFQHRGDTRHDRGLGLGLAIAQGFATTVGGTLECEDTPGGGCTMILTLPESR